MYFPPFYTQELKVLGTLLEDKKREIKGKPTSDPAFPLWVAVL